MLFQIRAYTGALQVTTMVCIANEYWGRVLATMQAPYYKICCQLETLNPHPCLQALQKRRKGLAFPFLLEPLEYHPSKHRQFQSRGLGFQVLGLTISELPGLGFRGLGLDSCYTN